ncbi:MAG: 23S rRNA (uracil(1939)-C(5))-methyltransferase RlmD [bacterium]
MTENPYRRGDEIDLVLDQAAFEGKCVGRTEGFVIFVEGAVPGDVVRVKLLKVKKNFAEASVVSILSPSPVRVEPRCKHFGVCGGCKWQHVDYQAQLRFKQQHVIDAFERIGGFSELNIFPIIGSENQYFYRNKMEYSFSDMEWVEVLPEKSTPSTSPDPQSPYNDSSSIISPLPAHQNVFLGLHVPQRYDKVLEIQECHLQSQLSNRVLNFVRMFSRDHRFDVYSSKQEAGYLRFLVIRQSVRTKELMVNLVTFEHRPDVMRLFTEELRKEIPEVTTIVNTINRKRSQIAFGEEEFVYLGKGSIHETLGGLTFTISPASFFQTNTVQAEKLYQVAASFANLKPEDVVWDLYSGTGSIALVLSAMVKEVVGIESVHSAVKDAERNARHNSVTNCRFILGDLKDCLTKDTAWMEKGKKPDVMVIDPPRSGMHSKVVEEILALAPSRIVYVSCNPATQARDVKLLCDQKYRLTALQPVDIFPHTYHVENVVQLMERI